MKLWGDARRAQVLQIAFELQAKLEAQSERELSEARFRTAALEVGLDPGLLARAEDELARREQLAIQAAARGHRRRRFVAIGAMGAVGLGAVGFGLARVFFPPPPAPWVESFDNADAAGRWALNVNLGTRATLTWRSEPGRGQVAVVQVARFVHAQDGTYHVNLDGLAAPETAAPYRDVVVDLKGSLPTARVFLEAGDAGTDVRWRSAPIAIQGNWTTHRLPLRSFERQRRQGGRWRSASWSAPERVSQVSLKLGHYMNPVDQTGELFVDALRFESP